jgi:Fe2+ transport system protein FeoA
MKNVTLAQLKAGCKARILGILGGRSLEDKLMSMGLYKGKELTKVSHIGLRGPVVVKVGRSILALGHGIAMKIMVEAY